MSLLSKSSNLSTVQCVYCQEDCISTESSTATGSTLMRPIIITMTLSEESACVSLREDLLDTLRNLIFTDSYLFSLLWFEHCDYLIVLQLIHHKLLVYCVCEVFS